MTFRPDIPSPARMYNWFLGFLGFLGGQDNYPRGPGSRRSGSRLAHQPPGPHQSSGAVPTPAREVRVLRDAWGS
jgi:hypothetical protein